MLQYLSFALAKTPYMGVGRNLGYKKSLFFSVKGFASHIHIQACEATHTSSLLSTSLYETYLFKMNL